MKPTRFHHTAALSTLHSLYQSRPDIDSRAAVAAGSEAEKIQDAIYLLDEVAGAYAMNERSRHTEGQFEDARALILGLIPQAWKDEQARLASERDAADRAARIAMAHQAPKQGNRDDRRRAERLAGRLGLTDRAGQPYPMA